MATGSVRTTPPPAKLNEENQDQFSDAHGGTPGGSNTGLIDAGNSEATQQVPQIQITATESEKTDLKTAWANMQPRIVIQGHAAKLAINCTIQ